MKRSSNRLFAKRLAKNIAKYSPFFVIFGAILFTSGCTSTRLSEQERFEAYENFKVEEALEEVKRIPNVSNSRWTPLGEQHLILYRGANRPFLVTLKRRCFDLDSTFKIKINAFGNSLSPGTDSISVLDGHKLRCFIDTIHIVTPEQKKMLVKLGRRDNEDATPPAES